MLSLLGWVALSYALLLISHAFEVDRCEKLHCNSHSHLQPNPHSPFPHQSTIRAQDPPLNALSNQPRKAIPPDDHPPQPQQQQQQHHQRAQGEGDGAGCADRVRVAGVVCGGGVVGGAGEDAANGAGGWGGLFGGACGGWR
jgi:hypothetical protein